MKYGVWSGKKNRKPANRIFGTKTAAKKYIRNSKGYNPRIVRLGHKRR